MKNNFNLLMTVYKLFPSEHFYSYSVTNFNVLCLCRFNQEILLKAINQYRFKLSVSPSGSIWLSRNNNIMIIMTD